MAELWCTHDLPGIRWDPEDEPDDDEPGPRITTVELTGEYL